MQLISKYNKAIRFLLCVTDLFSKYAWVVPLKDKIWVDQSSEFYNSFFKKWLQNNDLKMYSTYNEAKSAAVERFIGTLKNTIYKHMTAVPKNVYFDMLNNIVDKYNKTYHKTIKMKPVYVTSSL